MDAEAEGDGMTGLERELYEECERLKAVVHECRIAEMGAKHEVGELREKLLVMVGRVEGAESKLKWEREITRVLKVRAGWLDKGVMARDISEARGVDWRMVGVEEVLGMELRGLDVAVSDARKAGVVAPRTLARKVRGRGGKA